jgi:hypothetical protein
MKWNTLWKGITVILLAFVTAASAAYTGFPTTHTPLYFPPNDPVFSDGSFFTWEDDFFNESNIDPEFSYNYVVDTDIGQVTMDHTYPVWENFSDWTRMKPIVVTNSGEALAHYVLSMTIAYESEMKADYGDLRFAAADGQPLSYWIGERTVNESAEVMVLLPEVPASETLTIYLFYGNPTAVDESDFTMVFTWREHVDPDIMVSWKAPVEGAWDPDVAFGDGRFLVAWEERIGPEDMNPPEYPVFNMERSIASFIHGRTYSVDGADPYPNPEDDVDINISIPNILTYHAENPSVAYGGNRKFFVVWEQNPAEVLERYEADIKAAVLTFNPDGTLMGTLRFDICTAPGGQFDPCVAYDTSSGRFLVVWEDARYGSDDYEVYGSIFDIGGNELVSDIPIDTGDHYQGQPWVCSTDEGMFMVVYEDGPDGNTGPFSLHALRVASSGIRIFPRLTIASGSSNVDYIFPSVTYSPQTERYCFVWNDGDISVDPTNRDNWDGNIWGKLVSTSGSTITDNFIIEPGTSYICADVVPYFETLFFVSYDGKRVDDTDIFGRVIAADGNIVTSRQEFSDGSSVHVDWNNLAVGEDRIFVTWEDERDLVSEFADTFGSIWQTLQTTGVSEVSYTVGEALPCITEAVITSVLIEPLDLKVWDTFSAEYVLPHGALRFDILNHNATEILLEDVAPHTNLSAIVASALRLQATFTRQNPFDTPILDTWNVSWYIETDTQPPSTSIELDPAEPDGANGWYRSPITITLTADDDVSPPENITTLFRLNNGENQTYNPDDKPVITEEGNTSVQVWSVDEAGNIEPPQVVWIPLDGTKPTIDLHTPTDEVVDAGDVEVNGSVFDATSGIHQVTIEFNDDTVYSSNASQFEWHFTAKYGQNYNITIQVVDRAGNIQYRHLPLRCTGAGIIKNGYLYLFDYEPIPVELLKALELAVVINYDEIYLRLPEFDPNATAVKFVASRIAAGNVFPCWDYDLSDGCSCRYYIPVGFYRFKALAYDADDVLLEEYPLASQVFVLLI